MTRGGQPKTREAPERRCIATGVSGETAGLIRFVLDPEGGLTPDLAERLPGRGTWLSATREAAALAAKKRLFSRGFKQPVEVSDDLPDQLESLLARRLIEAISLTRKAGLAVNGFEKVKARLKQGGVGVLLAASDGSEDGKGKLAPLAGEAEVVSVLTADELGMAFGRDSVVHAALDVGGATDRVLREARRLDGFRQSG